MVIRAVKEDYEGNAYTSARISTRGKVSFTWGRIEIKAKLVKGKGLFPAFWLVPVNNTFGNYKKNGEIDIMEMLGQQPNTIYGVAHYSFNKKNRSYGKFVSKNLDFSQEFHIYSLEWTPERLTWLIDNTPFYSFNHQAEFPSSYQPFQQPFFLVINLAVGGDWPGTQIDDSALPAEMEIAYVKYYELLK